MVLVCPAQQDPKALEATAVAASLLVPCSTIGPSNIPKIFVIHINQTYSSAILA